MASSSSDASESRVASVCRRPKFRAPTEQGGLLIEPPISALSASLKANADILCNSASVGILGGSLPSIRTAARAELLDAARDFTTECGLSVPAGGSGPWIVTGHQPSLFHPGVWAKNFFAASVAHRLNGRAINLIVDNDAVGAASVGVPSGDRKSPRLASVPFASLPKSMPWEEVASVKNTATHDTANKKTANNDTATPALFPDRVRQSSLLSVDSLLLPAFWTAVTRFASEGRPLHVAVSIARAEIERDWGAGTLELPVSRLSETAAFRLFVARLATECRTVAVVYDSVLDDYRRRHRIRSRSHPVSDLKTGPNWVETPFWTWRAGDAARRRLFARPVNDRVELSDGASTLGSMPACTSPSDHAAAVKALEELSRKGIRIRPRALTTTLFARLFFADLFVHGIGGAVYDEMTDELITRLVGIPAPRFQTVSGTLRLPLDGWPVTPDDVIRAKQQLRDMRYNPERHLPSRLSESRSSDRVSKLTEAKQTLLVEQSAQPTDRVSRRDPRRRRAARQRYLAMLGITYALFRELAPEYERLSRHLEAVQQQLAANGVLTSREYSFVLHRADSLRGFFQSMQRQCESIPAG
jgi:hypothetical protein